MNKTNPEDFEKFKHFVNHWINFFGLYNWEINFGHKEDDESMAYTTYNILNRHVRVVLAADWGEHIVTEAELDKTAFHEVCEILFLKLRYIAEARFISDEETGEEIHNVIRTLEKVVWKPIKEII